MNHLEKITQRLIEQNIDQLIITDFYNLYYFAEVKIHTGERLLALVVSQNTKPVFVVNHLFTAPESDLYDIVYYDDTEDSVGILSQYVVGKKIAVDNNWSCGFLLRLMEKHPAEYVSGTDMMARLRCVKDEEEKKCMIQASLDNDRIMGLIRPYIKEGVTEKYLYNKLLELFEQETKEPCSFPPIVGFGANCADPHHESDDSVLKKGDSIIIDMGSHYHGYCSDMTRTFLYHNPKIEEIYDLVRKANEAAEAAIRPGMKLKEIDQIARDIITEAGYGPYFNHRLGHGIGLEDHEPYDVSATDDELIVEGMCFSVEPGIYLPGIGGVRIEDIIYVEKDGALVLNHYSKEKDFLD